MGPPRPRTGTDSLRPARRHAASRVRAATLSAPMQRTTAIFSKRPAPGEVKTRLCPPLAPDEAARLAEAMLADVVERCARHDGFRTVLWFAPADAEPWFRARFGAALELRPQVGDGLGQRLAAFFESELDGESGAAGARTAVAIGSDAPLVGTDRVVRAHEALERGADLVLGPDAGGGYYLVGMRRAHGALLRDVPMSTASMRDETIALAERLGLAVELLEPGYDVDVERDLVRLRRDLERAPARDFPRHTSACLRAIASPNRCSEGA